GPGVHARQPVPRRLSPSGAAGSAQPRGGRPGLHESGRGGCPHPLHGRLGHTIRPDATLTILSEACGLNNDPVLVVHGGAWAIPDDMVEAHLTGVRSAIDAGWRVLESGGSALDAVEESIVVMEDDEAFDAGRG